MVVGSEVLTQLNKKIIKFSYVTSCSQMTAACFTCLGLPSDPEYGGSMFPRNVDELLSNYTA
jgi:hypothetical protein